MLQQHNFLFIYASHVQFSQVYPTTVHITALLVQYETPTGRTNKGVATSWLATKQPSEGGLPVTAPIYIRRSQFRYRKYSHFV
jgi:NADPH-ferrihemoprotein reductase